jgi:hypothetical protein
MDLRRVAAISRYNDAANFRIERYRDGRTPTEQARLSLVQDNAQWIDDSLVDQMRLALQSVRSANGSRVARSRRSKDRTRCSSLTTKLGRKRRKENPSPSRAMYGL